MKRKTLSPMRTPKDTLFIIGNGFDIWQELNTSYDEFRKYYLSHRKSIMRKLLIKSRIVMNSRGKKREVSDVELIYGNPFRPQELDQQFWGTFETSLDKLNAEQLNLYFGKDRHGLRKMEKSIRNANRILKKAFCDWIATIVIDEKDSGYCFGDNCLFVNFNYTDTLLKRFHVQERDEYHIHGEASDRDSIIFGHASHPHLPESALFQMGGRFRGLYLVEKILYETDKHVQDNIQMLCAFLALHGAIKENIKDIYILGHSMSLPDIEYFAFLMDATRIPQYEEIDEDKERAYREKSDTMDELHNRLQYAIQHGNIQSTDPDINPKYRESVLRKFAEEQEERSVQLGKDFLKMLHKKAKGDTQHEMVSDIPERAVDARWHITYFRDKDRQWMEHIMKAWGFENYELYPTIDECLKLFSVSTDH